MQKININSSLPEVFKMQMDASNPLDEIKLYEQNICKDNQDFFQFIKKSQVEQEQRDEAQRQKQKA